MIQHKLWKPTLDSKMILKVILVSVQLTFGFKCGLINKNFLTATNVILKNFVYKNKTVPNHVICGRDCSMDTNCKSFNFQEATKLCELSNTTRVGYPSTEDGTSTSLGLGLFQVSSGSVMITWLA